MKLIFDIQSPGQQSYSKIVSVISNILKTNFDAKLLPKHTLLKKTVISLLHICRYKHRTVNIGTKGKVETVSNGHVYRS